MEYAMPSGYIFYEDNDKVGIITFNSSNDKTGLLEQTWILNKNVVPHIAIDTGEDKNICGNCKHRGKVLSLDDAIQYAHTLKPHKRRALLKRVETKRTKGLNSINVDRKCYVKTFQAPLSVWKSYKKGNYEKISLHKLSKLLTFRSVRVGSYGDPAVIPNEVWDKMLSRTLGNTGYTHQWQKCEQRYSRFNMASVDSLEEKRQANKLGYRTFRTRLASEPIESDEVVCLSDKVAREGKKLVSCADCMMCSGNNSKVKKNIAIIIH
tara:strand:+ start:459 stop:1253 length:795 start_codon:yes stop_codon:yes gene_type:complete